jgi:uncharacterized protein (TIGR02118 family)
VVKVVWVARFKRGMSAEEGSRYWTEVHAPLGLKAPHFVGYVQNHVRGAIGAGSAVTAGDVAFDGYSCEWWTDEAGFRESLASPEWKAVVEDGANVFDPDSLRGMCGVLEERVMRKGPAGPFKVVWFARFRSDVPRDEASEHWRRRHGPIALRVPWIDRYVQNLVTSPLGADGVDDDVEMAFDGFSECWFADREAFQRSLEAEPWAELIEDGYTFLDMDALVGMSAILEERVILPPPPGAGGIE